METYNTLQRGQVVKTSFGEFTIKDIEYHSGLTMLSFEGTPIRCSTIHLIGYVDPREAEQREKRQVETAAYLKARTPLPGLKKGKIDPTRWLQDIEPEYRESFKDYIMSQQLPILLSSQFGRSQAEATCSFCGFIQRVYVWSFAGSGKRCDNCGVLLTHRHAFAEIKKLPREFRIYD